MTNAPTSRTSTAGRVRVGAVVVPSCGAAREAGAYRPLVASAVRVLLVLLALMQPSAASHDAWRMGGLQGIPVH